MPSDLENIRDFAVSMKSKNFFKAMLHADDVKLKIEELERRIWSSCLGFQVCAMQVNLFTILLMSRTPLL